MMKIPLLSIPFLCAILFRLGGWGEGDFAFNNNHIFCLKKGNKNWRWFGIGLLIAISYALRDLTYTPLLCFLTYIIATNWINYGETQIWRKIFGRDGSWIFYGACFGLASFPVLGLLSLVQAIFSSIVFLKLMQLSNDGIVTGVTGYDGIETKWFLDQKYVEIFFGLFGTIFYLLK